MINDIFFALKILISIYIKRKKKIFLYLTIFISSYIIKFHNVNENKHKKKKKKKKKKKDLKPENLLLNSQESNIDIKVADFGLASIDKNMLLQTSCGTLTYAVNFI